MDWSRKWQPTPVFLTGKSHGQRAWQAAVYGITKSQTRLSGKLQPISLGNHVLFRLNSRGVSPVSLLP